MTLYRSISAQSVGDNPQLL